MELCDHGEVLISEAYCWSDTGACSVQAMLHYMVHLARTSWGKFSTPVLAPVLSPRAKKDQPDSGGGLLAEATERRTIRRIKAPTGRDGKAAHHPARKGRVKAARPARLAEASRRAIRAAAIGKRRALTSFAT